MDDPRATQKIVTPMTSPLLRMMTEVERWGVVPMTRRRTIADHTYFVLIYAMEVCNWFHFPDKFRAQVFDHTLFHDTPEVRTGDMPGPAKRNYVAPHHLEAFERMTLADMGIHQLAGPPDAIKWVIKVADNIDAAWEIAWEMAKGNRLVANLLQSELDRAERFLFKLVEENWQHQASVRDHWMVVKATILKFANEPNVDWYND